MATDCCCNPSVANVLCIHLLAYDEMRFYQTCKTIYTHQHERREWWQHVRQLDGLAFHRTPGMGQRSWNCFTTWRVCVTRGTFPDFPDEAEVVTPSPDESALTEWTFVQSLWDIDLCQPQRDQRTHMRTLSPGWVHWSDDRLLGQPAQEPWNLKPTHSCTTYPRVHVW